MQDRPSASELLATLAEMLEEDVLPATEGLVQHYVRVGVNLCRILEREAKLGATIEADEVARLQRLLGSETRDALMLNRALDLRLAYSPDDAFVREAWRELLAITRGKLLISKPGHDDYDFASEPMP